MTALPIEAPTGPREDEEAAVTTLADQVACLDRLDDALLERLRHEVLTVPTGWKTEYGDYQSGGWGTLSLLNATGDPADVTIADCDPVETSLLAAMPTARTLLRALGLRYMWVRLARLDANAFLWEHRDYTELDEVDRYRLHIPVVTNSSAFLVTGGTAVHMTAGRIWRLTPTYAHGVCNLLGPERIHLIADCYADRRLDELTADPQLPDSGVRRLPPATEADLARHARTAAGMAGLGYVQAAERYLLRLFYAYALPEGRVYDLIADLYEHRDDDVAASDWRAKKTLMLGRG